jgi:BolA protein
MSLAEQIEAKLISDFAPERLSISNDSKRHAGPANNSHFRLIVVAQAFDGHNPVARQRQVFACLADELAGPVHALQMKCLTPAEFEALGGEVELKVPPCRGAHRSSV